MLFWEILGVYRDVWIFLMFSRLRLICDYIVFLDFNWDYMSGFDFNILGRVDIGYNFKGICILFKWWF